MVKNKILKKILSLFLISALVILSSPAGYLSAAPQSRRENGVSDKEVTSLEKGYYLTVYSTETDFYAKANNLSQETKSVYMAASRDGKEFEVLNNGGGVIFSKNIHGTLAITNPKIYKEDNEFIVTATDADPQKGVHIFTSKDGVNYYDDKLVDSDNRTASTLEKSSFRLMLNGENILETDEKISLGNVVELTEEEYSYIVNKLGTVVNTGVEDLGSIDVVPGDDVAGLLQEKYAAVNAIYSDGSDQSFRIDWNEALKGVDFFSPGSYTLTGQVIQPKYLNKLKELNGSNLFEDDPDNRNEEEKDHYDEATKTVYYDETKFVEGMADPCIYWDETTGYYYMTGSYFPEEGDAIDAGDKTQQYDRVVLRRSKTLEGLQNRKDQVTIWKAGNQGFIDNGSIVKRGYRNIWAPEIHRVGKNWVIYFTESHSSDAFNIYCHALVLDGSIDPYETALISGSEASQWQDYKMCVAGGIGNDPFKTSFCLDMTYFKDDVNGTSYVIWAGKPTAAYMGGSTDLFIAKVDEENPWIVISEATRISKSDYGWERVRYCVNEGPTVLQKDGKIFMCYSASGTGSEYAIGMCSAQGGADLLEAEAWTKSPYPVLTSRDVAGEEGPGHNSFTVDQDGNVIFVYHARPTSHNSQMCGWDGKKSSYNNEPLNDPCRHARLKRVHWAVDGTPILKMTYENELLDKNHMVTVQVNIKEPYSQSSDTKQKSDVLDPLPSSVGTGTSDVHKQIKNVRVVLNAKKLVLGEKETYAIKAKTTPKTKETIAWSSSRTKVAVVKNGKITARKKGTAVITASIGTIRANCRVIVRRPPGRIVLNAKKKIIKRGKTFQLKVKLPPKTASKKITYSSSDKQVATVNKTGKVKAKKTGKAFITARTFNGRRTALHITVK